MDRQLIQAEIVNMTTPFGKSQMMYLLGFNGLDLIWVIHTLLNKSK